MTASGWWRLGSSLSLLSAVSLVGAALAPLWVRPPARPGVILPVDIDLACLFVPTRADWAAHLVSYVIVGLLLVGGSRGVARLLGQTWRTRQTLQRLLHLTCPLDPALQPLLARLHLTGRVDLVQAATPLAFCYGLLWPRICLSTGLVRVLTEAELTALLWHERYHLLRRDPLKVALGRAGAGAFFFLPVVQALYSRYLLAKEVDADAYACQQQGSAEPLTDALCVLIDLRDAGAADASPPQAAGATDALEVRIAELLGQPQALPWPLAAALRSAVLLGVLVGVEGLVAQAGVANALWELQHSVLGGC